jgi:hypothetical protein
MGSIDNPKYIKSEESKYSETIKLIAKKILNEKLLMIRLFEKSYRLKNSCGMFYELKKISRFELTDQEFLETLVMWMDGESCSSPLDHDEWLEYCNELNQYYF